LRTSGNEYGQMMADNPRAVGGFGSHTGARQVEITREDQGMASLIDRITRLARSPQGQRLAQRAQEIARDPNTRRKIEELRVRLMKKH
jgi:hypothetical protein